MLGEASGGRTDLGPMPGWLARSRTYERQPDVFAVSINAGFSHSDIAEIARVILCDSGALCGPERRAMPYSKVARPMFPLDQDIDIAAWKAGIQNT